MAGLVIYNRLKEAVSSASEQEVRKMLSSANIKNIHTHFCDEPPAKRAAVCTSCEELLGPPLRQRDTGMLELLLQHGACASTEICATEYRYGRRQKPSTPLKLAVESGTIDDVRTLLSAGDDVNLHPRICLQIHNFFLYIKCTDCDSPLMAAVRRRDVAMIRLLVAHGASVSQVIHGAANGVHSKTALLVAAGTGDEEVITELVTSGADVNQSLGPGLHVTVLYHFWYDARLVKLLLKLGADPNAGADETGASLFRHLLHRGRVNSVYRLDSVLQTLSLLLPTTRDLDEYLVSNRAVLWLNTKCTMLLLQHGARIKYSQVFLGSAWADQSGNARHAT